MKHLSRRDEKKKEEGKVVFRITKEEEPVTENDGMILMTREKGRKKGKNFQWLKADGKTAIDLRKKREKRCLNKGGKGEEENPLQDLLFTHGEEFLEAGLPGSGGGGKENLPPSRKKRKEEKENWEKP